MSFFGTLWTKIKTAIEGDAQEVEDVIDPFEQKLMQGASALAHQIISTIGTQGYTVLEQGLSDIATVIASGGNVGAAIAALIPQVVSQVKDDLKQDATNAAHGAVSLILATLPLANTQTPPVATPAP